MEEPYIVGEPDCDVEVWSHAMGAYEPCQVGNEAALSRISHVP